jgi:hypothetical protein
MQMERIKVLITGYDENYWVRRIIRQRNKTREVRGTEVVPPMFRASDESHSIADRIIKYGRIQNTGIRIYRDLVKLKSGHVIYRGTSLARRDQGQPLVCLPVTQVEGVVST